MFIHPSGISNTAVLSRIVAPPVAGTSTSPTQVNPKLFVVDAGARGLNGNFIDKATAVALTRNHEANTGSPNAVSNVGQPGSSGSTGGVTSQSLIPVAITSAITGPSGSTVNRTIGRPGRPFPTLALICGVALGIGLAVIL